MTPTHEAARQRLALLLEEHPRDAVLAGAILQDLHEEQTAFAPYTGTRKVAVFGSARSPANSPEAVMATEVGRLFAADGWMVTTGGGPGVMAAATAGAGLERSFAININLPFEYDSAGFAADDPKVVHSEFFFTRKLAFFRQSDAFVVFPGGLGTMDELFELLTLMQTGRTPIAPIVLAQPSQIDYWDRWLSFTAHLADGGFISADDLSFVRLVQDPATVVQQVSSFWANFTGLTIDGSTARITCEHLPSTARGARQNEGPQPEAAIEGPGEQIETGWVTLSSVGVRAAIQRQSAPDATPQPGRSQASDETAMGGYALTMDFDGRSFSLLRQVIDEVNSWVPPGRST
jgi:uncharacterized protein (TIGR00730 family)